MQKTFLFFVVLFIMVACNNQPETAKTDTMDSSGKASSVQFPYTPTYSAQWNDEVPDEDVLAVLNSYKYWETGDMAALAGTMADSISFRAWNGFKYDGPKDSLMQRWVKSRDSLSSVSIEIAVWRKSHSIDKNENFVNVWYKEIDTYKDGKIDSAFYEDDNYVKDGKIAWYAQQKRVLK